MNDDQSSKTLIPSFSRVFVRIFLIVLFLIAIGAVSDRYRTGHWWSADYFASLAIPLFLSPACIWFMFVPRHIKWSAAEFQIQPRIRRGQTLPWTQLYSYGSGNNVFLLEFTGVSRFQIFAGAFNHDEWQNFRSFLTANYPEKKASFWAARKQSCETTNPD